MKHKLLLFAAAMLLCIQSYAQTGVAINTTGADPHPSAMLDVSATNKGILVPRMTETQRTTIGFPVKGLLVYQNNGTEGFYYYDGSTWTRLASGTFTESDPVYNLSPASAITSSDIINWNTAYGWGDHAGLYRPVAWVPSWSNISGNPFHWSSPANGDLMRYDLSTEHWENFAPDYLTSFTETDPIVKAVSGIVKSNGTTILSAIAGTDYLAPTGSAASLTNFPTLNQITTGTAANVTGTIAISNGGTGQTTKSAAFNALSPMAAQGDIIYGGTDGYGTVLSKGNAGEVLKMNEGASTPEWSSQSLSNFTENNYSNSGKTGVRLLATNAATDVDFVLSPKGSGAIIAQQPDGTSTGGENRGSCAVDLQLSRGEAGQVASGSFSVIAGGYWNEASKNHAAVGGGSNNTAFGSYATIPGGKSNSANEFASVAFGANNQANGMFSTASGNYNSADGDNSFAAGSHNFANDYMESVFGQYATVGYGSTNNWVGADRLFTVGNGTGAAGNLRSNALTILKNANTTIGGSLAINANGINTDYTFPSERGAIGQVLKTNADGTTGWGNTVEAGTAAGQMLYWNGTAWVTVPNGTTGQLLSINSSGQPEWQSQLSIITASTLAPTMTSSGVTFKGVVNPNNLYAAHLFEYGITTDYGNTTEMTYYTPSSTNNTISSTLITGLTLGITYHVRLITQTILGTFYSNDITFTYLYPGAPLYLGATYQEGLVFSLDETGQHGKVCAFYDQSASASWYDALDLCAAYSSGTVAPNIYSDWYLPSSNDLTLIYNNLKLNSLGSFSNSFYWSFETFNDTEAFYVNFGNGNVAFGDKNANYNVRAVRDF